MAGDLRDLEAILAAMLACDDATTLDERADCEDRLFMLADAVRGDTPRRILLSVIRQQRLPAYRNQKRKEEIARLRGRS